MLASLEVLSPLLPLALLSVTPGRGISYRAACGPVAATDPSSTFCFASQDRCRHAIRCVPHLFGHYAPHQDVCLPLSP